MICLYNDHNACKEEDSLVHMETPWNKDMAMYRLHFDAPLITRPFVASMCACMCVHVCGPYFLEECTILPACNVTFCFCALLARELCDHGKVCLCECMCVCECVCSLRLYLCLCVSLVV